MFKPKNQFSSRSVIEGGGTTANLAIKTPVLPTAKLNTNFHKPQSIKYEKKQFLNALSVLVRNLNLISLFNL